MMSVFVIKRKSDGLYLITYKARYCAGRHGTNWGPLKNARLYKSRSTALSALKGHEWYLKEPWYPQSLDARLAGSKKFKEDNPFPEWWPKYYEIVKGSIETTCEQLRD